MVFDNGRHLYYLPTLDYWGKFLVTDNFSESVYLSFSIDYFDTGFIKPLCLLSLIETVSKDYFQGSFPLEVRQSESLFSVSSDS